MRKYVQKYLEVKVGHLLPKDNPQEKKEMLHFLIENFIHSLTFDAEHLGVCVGGSFAAADHFIQSTLEEHPSQLFHGLFSPTIKEICLISPS